jgi:hypothetical protein
MSNYLQLIDCGVVMSFATLLQEGRLSLQDNIIRIRLYI